MQFRRAHSLISFLILLWACTLQFACTEMTSQDSPEFLKTRAGEYWDLRLRGEFEKAFAYELPASVENVPLADYLTSIGRGVQWLGAEPEAVSIDVDRGRVTMKIRYKWTFTQNQPPEGLIGRYSEEWRLFDGKWYHVYTGRAGTKDPKAAPESGGKSEKPNTPLAPKTDPSQPAEPKAAVPEETGQPKTSESAGKPEASQAPQSEAGTGGKETNPSASSEKAEKQDEGSKKP